MGLSFWVLFKISFLFRGNVFGFWCPPPFVRRHIPGLSEWRALCQRTSHHCGRVTGGAAPGGGGCTGPHLRTVLVPAGSRLRGPCLLLRRLRVVAGALAMAGRSEDAPGFVRVPARAVPRHRGGCGTGPAGGHTPAIRTF